MNFFEKEALARQMKAQEREDTLILSVDKLVKRAHLVALDRAMHRERRQKEELAKGPPEKRDPLIRRNKDFVKNEYALIDETKDEQIRQEKIRQQLMNSPEIKNLQKQLQESYIRKQLQSHLEQKKLDRVNIIQSEYEEMQEMLKKEADNEKDCRQKEWNKKLEYRKLLQDQIINKYKLKQEEYREFLKERAVLEDSIRCTMEEDQMEEFRKVMQKNKIKKEIEDFRSAKALWILRETDALEEEDRKINEYKAMKEKQLHDIKEKEREKREALEKKKMIVSDILLQAQVNREKQEQAIFYKTEQELERRAKEKEEREYLRDKIMKKDLIVSFERQNRDKEERRRIQQQEERDYIMQKLTEYQENKKFEEMTAEKRRRLRMAYRSEILRGVEENKIRKKLEQQDEEEMRKHDLQINKKRNKIINEERLRILKQHTGQLIGFLPPGFLKTSDLPHLPQQVREFYTAKNQQPPQSSPDQ